MRSLPYQVVLQVATTSPSRSARLSLLLARIVVTWVFFMNAFGVIGQDKAVHEVMAAGVPARLASLLIKAGQLTQAVGGVFRRAGMVPSSRMVPSCALAQKLIVFLWMSNPI